NLPSIDLSSFEIDPEAVKLIPRQVCVKHVVIPVSRAGKNLVVAFADPSNIYVKDDLSLLTRMKIEVVVASEQAIHNAIERYYGGGATNIENLVSEIEESHDVGGRPTSDAEILDQEAEVDQGPIVKFVNAMLT